MEQGLPAQLWTEFTRTCTVGLQKRIFSTSAIFTVDLKVGPELGTFWLKNIFSLQVHASSGSLVHASVYIFNHAFHAPL